INVEFGTFYLAEQTDYFDGHMFAALAAYNAGPGNAEIWYGQADGDYDLFVELIRLDEPRRYVRRVYEHYAVYRDLYGR
ncbi:MAG: transglycosylase SLT domain-containing protein, partial [Anaerolineales bacterium]